MQVPGVSGVIGIMILSGDDVLEQPFPGLPFRSMQQPQQLSPEWGRYDNNGNHGNHGNTYFVACTPSNYLLSGGDGIWGWGSWSKLGEERGIQNQ